MRYPLFLSLLLLSFLATAQKLDGSWELMQRKGDNPCAAQMTLTFGDRGGAGTITTGGQSTDCPASTEHFAGWSVEKVAIKLRTGGTKKVPMVVFTGIEAQAEWRLLEYESDFMLLQIEAADGDSTRPKKFVFRRREESR